jgi:endonuclease/exonuclease/phosphatase family metal-dependent hydrolase
MAGRTDDPAGGLPLELTVATFNLRNFTAADGDDAWALRVDAVAEMIRATGARIVGTQEGYLDMLRQLGERLPEFDWVGLGRRGGDLDEFCAVFHRRDGPVPDEVGHFWLSETPEVPASSGWDSSLPRMCTWVRFRGGAVGPGVPLVLYNTHLDHRGGRARLEGIRLICRRLAERRLRDGLPALLMGDLNAGEESPVVRFLREESGLVDAYTALSARAEGPTGIGRTFHAFRGGDGGDPIDYIFGTPDLTFRHTEVRREQVAGRYPSDHYPVVATVRLAEA